MASFLKANLPSDEEEDEDYIPDPKDSDHEQETTEQVKAPAPVAASAVETAEQKEKVENLWKQLQQKTTTNVKSKNTVSVSKHPAGDVNVAKVKEDPGQRSESRKRSASGVDALLASFQKKKKTNVFEKSKTDWKGFKAAHRNDAEELSAHQKSSDQYLEKQEFLDRAVHKEYEINREKKSRR